MVTPWQKLCLLHRSPIKTRSHRLSLILPGTLSLLILSGSSIAPQSSLQKTKLSFFNQAAQAQTTSKFSAGQQIVIRYEGKYYFANVEKIYQDNGFTMVDFSWELEGGGGGSGTYPADDSGLFTLAEATRQNLKILNAKAGTPPAANTNTPAANTNTPVAQLVPVVPNPLPVAKPAPAAVTGNSSTCSGPNQVTAAEIQEILRVHNEARAEVNVPPLKWNCKLAEFAQKWVDRDVWKHSSGEDREKILGTYSGENIAGDGEDIATSGPTNWLSEKAFWNNATGSCQPGKVCGHYTQMVWRTTTEIGCGIKRKSGVLGEEYRESTAYLSCVYNPAGNFGDEKPF